ncbi:MAG: arylsulfatase [Salinibacter sp.]
MRLGLLRSLLGLGLGLLIGGAAGCSSPDSGSDRRPNVLVVLADDQGWGDLGVNGNTAVQTPHLDSLARQGAVFEHFYVQPVCSPTRAELLTGRYHPRGGVHGTSAGAERLDLDEHTIGETFRQAGYATGVFGKWHNGSQYPYHPNARGFGTFYGFTSGHWGHYFGWTLEQGARLVEGTGYLPNDLTDRALSFIEAHQDEPFFAYVPYNTPHSPMQVPDRFFDRYRDADLQRAHRYADRENPTKTRAALAMTENLDWNVGRLLDRLDALDLTRETIVLYFSDNGPNGWRWNANLRGRKGSTDEGGVRVPMIIRWPGEIAPGTERSQIAGAIDLLPTLADLAGIPVGADTTLDGRSLAPLLLGTERNWPDRFLFAHWNGEVSVRTPRFRLDHEGRLYDLAADPQQRTNVADEHPAVAERLRDTVAAWTAEMLPELEQKDRPFPVGHPDGPLTRLPARDGGAHGTIERSNRFPNSSFFRHWTSPQDSITWDVRVVTPGRYRATVYYTMAEGNAGVELALRFRGHSTRRTVTTVHDPPLVGKARDRIPRQESYVKDFRPLDLGTLRLEAGRGPLVLRAPKIPGREAVDVRWVELRRVEDADGTGS